MLSHNTYAVLEGETSGFLSTDRIIGISGDLLDKNLEIADRWDTVVQPESEILRFVAYEIAGASH